MSGIDDLPSKIRWDSMIDLLEEKSCPGCPIHYCGDCKFVNGEIVCGRCRKDLKSRAVYAYDTQYPGRRTPQLRPNYCQSCRFNETKNGRLECTSCRSVPLPALRRGTPAAAGGITQAAQYRENIARREAAERKRAEDEKDRRREREAAEVKRAAAASSQQRKAADLAKIWESSMRLPGRTIYNSQAAKRAFDELRQMHGADKEYQQILNHIEAEVTDVWNRFRNFTQSRGVSHYETSKRNAQNAFHEFNKIHHLILHMYPTVPKLQQVRSWMQQWLDWFRSQAAEQLRGEAKHSGGGRPRPSRQTYSASEVEAKSTRIQNIFPAADKHRSDARFEQIRARSGLPIAHTGERNNDGNWVYQSGFTPRITGAQLATELFGDYMNKTSSELKRAYKKLALYFHPDKYAGIGGRHTGEEMTKLLNDSRDFVDSVRGPMQRQQGTRRSRRRRRKRSQSRRSRRSRSRSRGRKRKRKSRRSRKRSRKPRRKSRSRSRRRKRKSRKRRRSRKRNSRKRRKSRSKR